ncbi:MAG: glycosyltransferase [Cyanobacteria bacterium P01_A01_bin.45]
MTTILKTTTFKKKVMFIIRDLKYGGAQRQLVTLVKGMNKEKFDITVLYFYDGGELEVELKNSNINAISLNKSGRWDILNFTKNIFLNFYSIRPDIVHGYLGESNLMATILASISPPTKKIWGIRDSITDKKAYDWFGNLLFSLECFTSKFANLIIVNSYVGKKFYLKQGYPESQMVVIPNGIDIKRFKPEPEKGWKLRKEWGLSEKITVIGLVGRLAPMKDHPTFFKAISILSEDYENIHFVCVGVGSEQYTLEMKELAEQLGIAEKIFWAGGRSDMEAVYNSLDILVSTSSYGEGFANVVGEAMACGIPCVVTDVGDSALIVGDIGIVVPSENPSALAVGCRQLINLSKEEKNIIKSKSRERIVNNFCVKNLVEKTESYLLKA